MARKAAGFLVRVHTRNLEPYVLMGTWTLRTTFKLRQRCLGREAKHGSNGEANNGNSDERSACNAWAKAATMRSPSHEEGLGSRVPLKLSTRVPMEFRLFGFRI